MGAPFCTIQAALNASVAGDEILVAPGLYVENLDFLGKDVALRSTAGPTTTIVDGGGAGSVVRFTGGEGPEALLEGFTLRNGAAFFPDSGGGVLCDGSSPTIAGNVIELNISAAGGGLALLGGSPLVTGNTVRDNGGDAGAGIHCGAGTTAHIIGNEIVSNGPPATTGGGIDVGVGAAPVIESNLIEGNVAAGGAGIHVDSVLGVVVRNNLIRDNHTDEGDGGGLFTGPNTLVEDNEIADNSAVNEGDGVWANGGTFRRNRITGNAGSIAVFAQAGASFDGDVISGDGLPDVGVRVVGSPGLPIVMSRVTISGYSLAIVHSTGELLLEDCLLFDNGQAAIAAGAGTELTLRRCTLAGSLTSDGVLAVTGAHATLESCIVWTGAMGSSDQLVAASGGGIDASWSTVRNGYPGTGNSDSDPGFTDELADDYSLHAFSPAVDSGNPADYICGLDLTGSPRRLNGVLAPELGRIDFIATVDRGALEFNNVRLTTSVPLPATLRIELTGTHEVQSWLFAGLAPAHVCIEKWGVLGVNLGLPYTLLPWPSAPSAVQAPIPPALSGLPIALQALVGPLPGTGPISQTGNFSNAVALELP